MNLPLHPKNLVPPESKLPLKFWNLAKNLSNIKDILSNI